MRSTSIEPQNCEHRNSWTCERSANFHWQLVRFTAVVSSHSQSFRDFDGPRLPVFLSTLKTASLSRQSTRSTDRLGCAHIVARLQILRFVQHVLPVLAERYCELVCVSHRRHLVTQWYSTSSISSGYFSRWNLRLCVMERRRNLLLPRNVYHCRTGARYWITIREFRFTRDLI